MTFTIPQSFRDPEIFAIAARIKARNEWNLSKLRRLVKDPEFRDFYYNLKSDFELSDLGEICKNHSVTLKVSHNKNLEVFGNGDSVYLKKNKRSIICFSPENFFYSPKGIGKRINEFREIISLFSINDIFSTGNYLLSDNQFMQIETDFKVSINIWSKTAFGSKSQHFDFKKLRIGSFR